MIFGEKEHIILINQKNKNNYGNVRLIDADGVNQGLVDINQAFSLANNSNFDLVLVNQGSKNPVCKIMDYNKYLFEKEKKAKRQHKRKIKTKEYAFRPSTEYHDIDIMINKCVKNLEKGHRILFLVKFKKRQKQYKDIGLKKMRYIQEKLSDVANLEKENEDHNSIRFLFVNKPND